MPESAEQHNVRALVTERYQIPDSLVTKAAFDLSYEAVRQWTPAEMRGFTMYMTGRDPLMVLDFECRRRGFYPREVGTDGPCAGGRCVDQAAHAEGAHDL